MLFLDTCSGRVMDTNVENVDELRRIVEEMDSAYTQNGCMTVAEYYDRIIVDLLTGLISSTEQQLKFLMRQRKEVINFISFIFYISFNERKPLSKKGDLK